MIQLPRVNWRLLACGNGASPDCIIVVVVSLIFVRKMRGQKELSLFLGKTTSLQNGLLIFFVKKHTPKTNQSTRQDLIEKCYNNNCKPWKS